MKKASHKEVKFSPAEMADDGADEIDFTRAKFVGRGPEGIEMARRISRARGAEKRKLIESLPTMENASSANTKASVQLDSDVAAYFKDSASVNKALRALISAIPALAPKHQRKSA